VRLWSRRTTDAPENGRDARSYATAAAETAAPRGFAADNAASRGDGGEDRRATQGEREMSAIHMAENAATRLIETINSQTAYELKQEELGWVRIGEGADSYDLSWSDREFIRSRCVALWQIDPTVAQAMSLLQSGTFGRGVGTPKANDKRIQPIIDRFWDDRDNKLCLLSRQGQMETNLLLGMEGERFFTLHTSAADSHVKIADIPVQEVVAVITHPQNRRQPVLYKRTAVQRKWDFGTGTWKLEGEKADTYYRDCKYPAERDAELERSDPDAAALIASVPEGKLIDDVLVYHLRVNTVGLRGIPELYRALDFARSHDRTLSSMVTLTRAQATIAWIKKLVTKSSAAIDKAAKQMRDPVPGVASTYVSNQAAELKPVDVGTGATSNHEKTLYATFLQTIRSFGFGAQWYGDPSTGNLATAKSMELPALWRIEDRQETFEQVFSDMTDFAVERAIAAGDLGRIPDDVDRGYRLKFPSPQGRDDTAAGAIITAIVGAVAGGVLDQQEASYQCYSLMGTDDIDAVMARQYTENLTPGPSPQSGEGGTTKAAEGVREAGLTKGEQGFADEVQANVIDPWWGKVKGWLEGLETAPAAEELGKVIAAECNVDKARLQAIIAKHGKIAAESGGQKALDKVAKAVRKSSSPPQPPSPAREKAALGRGGSTTTARIAEAEGQGTITPRQAGETLADFLKRGGGWNKPIGDFVFNLRNPELLKAIQERAAWAADDVTQSMMESLRAVLEDQFYRQGQGPAQVAQDLEGIFPPTYEGRAENIAQTETAIAQSKIGHETYTRNGVPNKQWFTTMDGLEREEHAAAHGQVKPIDEPFEVGGEEMMHPHDPGADPANICRCRCDELPVIGEGTELPEQPWEGT